jgi:hypothetical protein
MDANVINHPSAFPDAHINVDPWHFQQLFTNTLNKGSSVCNDVSGRFEEAMYTKTTNSEGRTVLTHAEPDVIVTAVDAIVKRYSHSGVDAPAVTKEDQRLVGGAEGQDPAGPHLQSSARCRRHAC